MKGKYPIGKVENFPLYFGTVLFALEAIGMVSYTNIFTSLESSNVHVDHVLYKTKRQSIELTKKSFLFFHDFQGNFIDTNNKH